MPVIGHGDAVFLYNGTPNREFKYGYSCILWLAGMYEIYSFERELYEIMISEDNEELLMKGMPLIIQMDESKSTSFFVFNLKKNSQALRNSCYVYLRKANSKILENVKNRLKEEGENDALNFIVKAGAGR